MHGALASHLQQLLAYHQWAYERILEAVAPLDEEAYRAPRGLFFDSLHGTLNHLAVVDRIWFARVQREPWQFERLDAEAAPDRADHTGHGPADQAGIETDDLIVSLGELEVTSVDDLHKLLTQLPVGIPNSVMIVRGQKRLQRFVLPEEYPHWDPARR